MKAPKTPVVLSQSELLTIYSEYCQYLYLHSCSRRAGHVSHVAALLTTKRICVLQMSANTENIQVFASRFQSLYYLAGIITFICLTIQIQFRFK